MSEEIVLIKLGGSLITDKKEPKSLKPDVIKNLVNQIYKFYKSGAARPIIGNGGGSFSHPPSEKYKVYKGYTGKQSLIGIAEVQDLGAQLNRIIVRKLIDKGVPAISINPSSNMISDSFNLDSIFLAPLKIALDLGMVPVVYGDVVFDSKKGCADISTEKIFNFISLKLESPYKVTKIVYCGNTPGILDSGSKTIKVLTDINLKDHILDIKDSDGVDTTGGMIHKVEEAFKIARLGIDSLIIDGNKKNNLFKALTSKSFTGTLITVFPADNKSAGFKKKSEKKSAKTKTRFTRLTKISNV